MNIGIIKARKKGRTSMLYDFEEHGLKRKLIRKKQEFLELSLISHNEIQAGIYNQMRSQQLMYIHEQIKSIQFVLDTKKARH